MGKNLKGKDCGKGIYQRKDGLYSARFVDRVGKRHEKYFQTPVSYTHLSLGRVLNTPRRRMVSTFSAITVSMLYAHSS